jgi:hypothetical protein
MTGGKPRQSRRVVEDLVIAIGIRILNFEGHAQFQVDRIEQALLTYKLDDETFEMAIRRESRVGADIKHNLGPAGFVDNRIALKARQGRSGCRRRYIAEGDLVDALVIENNTLLFRQRAAMM